MESVHKSKERLRIYFVGKHSGATYRLLVV